MFDYQKHKKVALAISTCNFEYRHKEWGEYGSYEERDTLQDISSLAIFPSKSHNFELIKSFFNLYHLPYSDFDETFPFYDNTTQISTQLEDYLYNTPQKSDS